MQLPSLPTEMLAKSRPQSLVSTTPCYPATSSSQTLTIQSLSAKPKPLQPPLYPHSTPRFFFQLSFLHSSAPKLTTPLNFHLHPNSLPPLPCSPSSHSYLSLSLNPFLPQPFLSPPRSHLTSHFVLHSRRWWLRLVFPLRFLCY